MFGHAGMGLHRRPEIARFLPQAYETLQIKANKTADSLPKINVVEVVQIGLSYEQETGEFRWKVRRGGTAKAGGIAGTFDKRGYNIIMIDGRKFLVHRLAFVFMTEKFPSQEVDHIDRVTGNYSDNRWSNLREASRSENNRNQGIRSENASRFIGVHFQKARGKWQAQIMVHSKQYHLGLFNTDIEAARAYDRAAIKMHGCFAQLNFMVSDYQSAA